MRSVAAISITPVKSLGLVHPEEIELTEAGVAGNRRFFLVDEGGRLLGGTKHGPLVRVRPRVEDDSLTLTFPSGDEVTGEVELGEGLTVNFYGRPVEGRVVVGPWADALSDYAQRHVRLVHAENGDAYDVEPATLVSLASCARLAEELGGDVDVDHRRFRMLLTLDGCEAHEEDSWRDREVRVGDAVLRVGGPVPRCAVTTHDPATGVRSLDTLGALKGYRGAADFGVYATVAQPGRVRVGDALEPL